MHTVDAPPDGDRSAEIGILLVGLPRMLVDLLASIVRSEPDLRIVGEFAELDPSAALSRRDVGFVIVGADAALPDVWGPAMRARPDVGVLGLSDRSGSAYLYELRPQAVPVGELSTRLLVGLIRSSAATA